MKNKKILFILFILFILSILFVPSILALEECGESIPINKECTIISPYLSYCSTYDLDIYNSSGNAFVSNGAISQIGSSGIYNYTANFTYADTFTIKLCDNSVRTVIALDPDSWNLGTSWWSYIIQIYHYVLEGGY